MTAKQRMKNGNLFYFTDEMFLEQMECLEILYDYNMTRPSEKEKRSKILKSLFAEIGENSYFEPPLYANWGKHTHVGSYVYANFNLHLVDDTEIYIGNNVMFGPNVVLATAGHPIEPELRRKQAQFNIPIKIEDNVWIGANVSVLPGISIGKNSVIGAGSVVTKDIPANVVAVGNPCKVLREINEMDKRYYYKNMEIDIE